MLPSKSWEAYEGVLKQLGELRPAEECDELDFLRELRFVDGSGKLSVIGQEYFRLRFVRGEQLLSDAVLQEALMEYPPAAAVCQLLEGVPDLDRARVETVLRSQGFGVGLNDRKIGSLLALMNRGGLVKYVKNTGKLTVLVHMTQSQIPPPSIFISPETPFGNKIWLRRILEECEGHIYWLDKHFLPVAFEALWEAIDGTRITEVRVLSLRLPANEGSKAMRAYKDLVKELSNRNVTLEWRYIDSSQIKATHDRWIIGSNSARNIPDVGTIFSGNHSELNQSGKSAELIEIFENYWTLALPVS